MFGISVGESLLLAMAVIIAAFILAFVIFILFLILSNVLVSIIGRVRFYIKLKRICRKHGFGLKKKHSLLRPFYNSYEGSDIIILSKAGEVAHLKFFPYFIRRKFSMLDKEGVLEMGTRVFLQKRFTNLSLPTAASSKNVGGAFFNIFVRRKKPKLGFDNTDAKRFLLVPDKNCFFKFYTDNRIWAFDNSVEFSNGSQLYDQKSFIKKIYDL